MQSKQKQWGRGRQKAVTRHSRLRKPRAWIVVDAWFLNCLSRFGSSGLCKRPLLCTVVLIQTVLGAGGSLCDGASPLPKNKLTFLCGSGGCDRRAPSRLFCQPVEPQVVPLPPRDSLGLWWGEESTCTMNPLLRHSLSRSNKVGPLPGTWTVSLNFAL